MLRERLFGPPPVDPALLLAARDATGRLVGVAAGVYPCRKEGVGGVRWLGTLPEVAGRGVEAVLLEELCRRLKERGAHEAHMMATPPHYLRPGVDTRETGLIATLSDLGWRHTATHFNMTCDLTRWRSPGEAASFAPDVGGCRVRRAEPGDREALRALIERHWTVGWRDAATLGLDHDPVGVFVAEQGGGLVGFAAYEVDQCLGSFGPTGVAESHRGRGLGRRLLWACLDDLQRLGRAECQIGWIGPVGFYYRACGAVLGPSYWLMELSGSFPPTPDASNPAGGHGACPESRGTACNLDNIVRK
jgi:N-acetylglutamate synthase-like GNAT family acetyltransferase